MTPTKRRLLTLAICGLSGIALTAFSFVLLAEPPARRAAMASERATPTTTSSPRDLHAVPATSTDPPPRQPPRAARPTPRDEATLMTMLRALAASDPNLSLKLAREGDVRFPASPEAAERGWFAARALVDLGRFDEAVAEARAMTRKYPGTRFADDVARHLLTHPLSHHTEAGDNADQ